MPDAQVNTLLGDLYKLIPTEEHLGLVTGLIEDYQARESELKREWAERRFVLQDHQLEEEARLDFIQHSLQRQLQRATRLNNRIVNMDRAVGSLVIGLARLNGAKECLQARITLLRKVQMLQAGIERLRNLLNESRYREMSSPLMATMQFVEALGPTILKECPGLSAVLKQATEVQQGIWQGVFELFQGNVGQRGGFQPRDPFLMADAALLVEILGPSYIKHLTTWYCEVQLKDYKSVFRGHPEWASLTSLQKRFHWLARLLETYKKDHQLVFLDTWKVPQWLCIHFCALTAKDIADSLGAKRDGEAEGEEAAEVLLSSIKESQAMEQKLRSMFPDAPPGSFNLSTCFEGNLHLFLKIQESELQHFMNALPKNIDIHLVNQLVASASTFWLLLRDAMDDIVALDSPKTTLGLFPLLGKYLTKYATYLQEHLPSKRTSSSLSADCLQLVCVLLNTANFCIGNGERLAERAKEFKASFTATSPTSPVSSVSPSLEAGLESALQAFHILASLCYNSLENHLNESLTPAWDQMASTIKTAWSADYQQGDRSTFTQSIAQQFHRLTATLSKCIIRPDTLSMVYGRLARSIIARFKRTLWNCRPVSESGAQQLLVDLHALRVILTDPDEIKKISPTANIMEETFLADLEAECSQIESLVKVILIPLDPPRTFVETYLVLIGDPDPDKFKKAIHLKGKINAVEQGKLMEEFLRRLPEPPSAKDSGPDAGGSISSLQQLKKTIKHLSINEGTWKKLMTGMAKVGGVTDRNRSGREPS